METQETLELARKYVFWCVLVGIVLAGVIVYYLYTPSEAELKALNDAVLTQAADVKKLHKIEKELKTEKHFSAANNFRKHLEEQEKKVWQQLADKRIKYEGEFSSAPNSPLDFDRWLGSVRKNILDMAERAGMQLPPDFAKTHLYDGTGNNTPNDQAVIFDRLTRMALISEVIQTLSTARTQVPIKHFDPDINKPENQQTTDAGVYALDALEILTPGQWESYHRMARDRAFQLGGASAANRNDPRQAALRTTVSTQKPWEAMGISVQFTAPAALMETLIQRLETNPKYFAVVRKIDTQRTVAPYPGEEQLTAMSPGMQGSYERMARFNTYYNEAPIQVLLMLDLITFNEAAARQMAEPKKPADPKAAAGRKK